MSVEVPIRPDLALTFFSTSQGKLQAYSEMLVDLESLIADDDGKVEFFCSEDNKTVAVLYFSDGRNVVLHSSTVVESAHRVDPEKEFRMLVTFQPDQKVERVHESRGISAGRLTGAADVYLAPSGSKDMDPELPKPGAIDFDTILENWRKSMRFNGVKPTFDMTTTFSVGDLTRISMLKISEFARIEFSRSITLPELVQFEGYAKSIGVDLARVSGGIPMFEWAVYLAENCGIDLSMLINGIDSRKMTHSQLVNLKRFTRGSMPIDIMKDIYNFLKNPRSLNRKNPIVIMRDAQF